MDRWEREEQDREGRGGAGGLNGVVVCTTTSGIVEEVCALLGYTREIQMKTLKVQ
jgi:hypothetical protein